MFHSNYSIIMQNLASKNCAISGNPSCCVWRKKLEANFLVGSATRRQMTTNGYRHWSGRHGGKARWLSVKPQWSSWKKIPRINVIMVYSLVFCIVWRHNESFLYRFQGYASQYWQICDVKISARWICFKECK